MAKKVRAAMITQKELVAYLKGIFSFLPGSELIIRKRGTHRIPQAGYYYGIWLKHLTLMWDNGYQKIPDSLVEFGPGENFGVGIAALLTGTSHYYALDVLKYSNIELNLSIFDQMVELFHTRSPRPQRGWPSFDHLLNKQLFPDHILTEEHLKVALHPDRLKQIRQAISNPDLQKKIKIKYIVPWSKSDGLEDNSIDCCLSHSVLQYVINIDELFTVIHQFLKPGAIMSHQIDLSAHNVSDTWNGHRKFSEWSWHLIKGKRPYFLNRLPLSAYQASIKKLGFKLICDLKQTRSDGLKKSELTEKWQSLSTEDLECCGAFIQAQKLF